MMTALLCFSGLCFLFFFEQLYHSPKLHPLQSLADVVVYSSAITACEKNHEWKMALLVFDHMQHASRLVILLLQSLKVPLEKQKQLLVGSTTSGYACFASPYQLGAQQIIKKG